VQLEVILTDLVCRFLAGPPLLVGGSKNVLIGDRTLFSGHVLDRFWWNFIQLKSPVSVFELVLLCSLHTLIFVVVVFF